MQDPVRESYLAHVRENDGKLRCLRGATSPPPLLRETLKLPTRHRDLRIHRDRRDRDRVIKMPANHAA